MNDYNFLLDDEEKEQPPYYYPKRLLIVAVLMSLAVWWGLSHGTAKTKSSITPETIAHPAVER